MWKIGLHICTKETIMSLCVKSCSRKIHFGTDTNVISKFDVLMMPKFPKLQCSPRESNLVQVQASDPFKDEL